MIQVLDFERPIAELENKLAELQHLSDNGDLNITQEVTRLKKKVDKLLHETYSALTPWQKVQVARHPQRPHFQDYIDHLIEGFIPLAGDRLFGEDAALVGGLGRFQGVSVMIMGTEKGRDTEDRIRHGFGMPRPEGYRKAQRLMRLADQFGMPVITLIDTPGAQPGVEAEARGQSEAIARCIETCLDLRVPLISIITGEGMSGGAIAIGSANEVLMLEHSIYTVISPEGCASILWRTADKKMDAAATQRLTAQDLITFKVVDAVIPEPLGGAHRNYPQTMEAVSRALETALSRYVAFKPHEILEHRHEKFINMGRMI